METSLQSSVFRRQPSLSPPTEGRRLTTADCIQNCSSPVPRVIIVSTHQPRLSLQFNVTQFFAGMECVRPRNAAGEAAILFHGAGFEEG